MADWIRLPSGSYLNMEHIVFVHEYDDTWTHVEFLVANVNPDEEQKPDFTPFVTKYFDGEDREVLLEELELRRQNRFMLDESEE